MIANIKSVLRVLRTRLRPSQPAHADQTASYSSIGALVAAEPEEWTKAKTEAKGGPKVLIATTVTGFNHVTMLESAIGAALTLRGAEVHYLVCDAVLPACLRAETGNMPSPELFERYEQPLRICAQCMAIGKDLYEPLGLPMHRLGNTVDEQERSEARDLANSIAFASIRSFKIGGMAVGEHAYAGALRYFARGSIENVPGAEIVTRRYLESSILTVRGVSRLVDQLGNLDSAVFHHGIYVPQGLIGEVCRAKGVPIVNWNPSYRKNTFIFSHEDTYHHTLMSEPTELWHNIKWNHDLERQIMIYLESRIQGTRDWIWFHEKPDEDFDKFAATIGLDYTKPVIGMLSNVMWDAQLHYPANAFPGMLEWAIETVRYFATRPDLQLLIRIHPAEIRGTARSMQPLADEIAKAFPTLPPNVFIIPPESPVSTYAAMARCDSAIIYGTKTGVELTSMGIPVIVGGEAWIRNKGLTRDAQSREDYFRLLDELPVGRRLGEDITRRARQYAYHFFFRRMLPLPFIEPVTGKTYQMRLKSLAELREGYYPGLDVVCDGILLGRPFVYEAERLGLHDREPV